MPDDTPAVCAAVGCTRSRMALGRYCQAHTKRRRLAGTSDPADRLDNYTVQFALTAAERFLQALPEHTRDAAIAVLQSYAPRDPDKRKDALLVRPQDIRHLRRHVDKARPVWSRFWLSVPHDKEYGYILRPCRFALAYRLAYQWLLDAELVGSGVENGWDRTDYVRACEHMAGRRLLEAVRGADVLELTGPSITMLGRQSFNALDRSVQNLVGTSADWLPAIAARDQFDELRSLTVEARKLALAA